LDYLGIQIIGSALFATKAVSLALAMRPDARSVLTVIYLINLWGYHFRVNAPTYVHMEQPTALFLMTLFQMEVATVMQQYAKLANIA